MKICTCGNEMLHPARQAPSRGKVNDNVFLDLRAYGRRDEKETGSHRQAPKFTFTGCCFAVCVNLACQARGRPRDGRQRLRRGLFGLQGVSLLAMQQTELLVDADTHSISIIQEAIAALEKLGHKVHTTIYAPKQRQNNKKWTKLLQKRSIAFRPVDRRRQDGWAGEEIDDEIIAAVRHTWSKKHVPVIALLTRDNGYLNIIEDTLSEGHRVIVLAEENCRAVLRRHEEVGAVVMAIQREHDHGCRVQAILHANGSGSVRQCRLQENLQETPEHAATALMQFFQDLGYRQDSGYLLQSATKFWFENTMGDLTVFPQCLALQTVYDAITRHRSHSFKKYKNDLAFVFPVTSRSGSKVKARAEYGSMCAKALFCGGGPFMLRDSAKLAREVLQKMGYLDGGLNSDLSEAMLAFVNRADNKHVLRKCDLLPSQLDGQQDVDDKLRAAFLSHRTKGNWQLPATDLEIHQLLHQQNLLSSTTAHRKVALEAMQKYAKQEGLPAITYASKELQADEEVAIAALAQSVMALKVIPEALWTRPVVRAAMLAAARRDPEPLKFCPEVIRGEADVMLEALKVQPKFASDLPAKLLEEKKFVLSAVQGNWQVLEHLPSQYTKDREVVSAAVAQSPFSLRLAGMDLRGDRELVLECVRQSSGALRYAATELLGDAEVVLAAVRQDVQCLRQASETLRNDKDLMLEAVRLGGIALQFASPALQDDREVVLAAVEQSGHALEFASEALRADREVVLAAVRQDKRAMSHAGKELRADLEVLRLARGAYGGYGSEAGTG
eukprot:s226_g11.t4